ncbi:MAG TPA: hypothetical protein DD473_14235 [Planctomycetaceae bacterium]|nr:hypothetical protein [Planctomycetaceae bacterium]
MINSRPFLRRLLASSLISAGIVMLLLLIIIGYQRSQISVRSQIYLRKIIQRDFPEEFQNSQGLRVVTEKIAINDDQAIATVKISQQQSWLRTELQLTRHDASGWQVRGVLGLSSADFPAVNTQKANPGEQFDHSLNQELKTAFGGTQGIVIQRY